MIIKNARYLNADNSMIQATLGDGKEVSIPTHLDNRHRQVIAEWEAQGNTIEPYVEPEKGYEELRRGEYPDMGDQLDALFHEGVFPADMAAKLQAVKDKYPKEEE
jgi:hypothetical protein